jgi:hypothetical protein
MARINVRIGITPSIDKLSELFEKGLAEAADWMPLWPLVVERLIEGIKGVIESRGADLSGTVTYGHVWQAADPRYLRRKAREGHGAVDLLYFGKLLAQVTTTAGIKRVTPRQLVFGTRGLKYATFINFVKRPFLGMSESMTAEVQGLMVNYLSQVANRACRAAGGAR